MIKHVFIGYLNGINEIEAWRWYVRYHSKEAIRFFGPWLRRYETYRAYPPPPEAKRFGAVGGYVTELWFTNVEEFIESKCLPTSLPGYGPLAGAPYTFPDWHETSRREAVLSAMTIVPAVPTEDFLGKELTPEEKHILRWYRAFKYPEGVSLKRGEKWYLEVHSQEVKKQTGLLRYISHRVPDNSPIETSWHRTEELWYEDFDAWRKAVIGSPPDYTPPSWSKREPFVDMASTFISYKPTVDWLRDNPTTP